MGPRGYLFFFLIGAALTKFIRGKLLIPNNSGWDFFAC